VELQKLDNKPMYYGFQAYLVRLKTHYKLIQYRATAEQLSINIKAKIF
jgi:hypothetical protein